MPTNFANQFIGYEYNELNKFGVLKETETSKKKIQELQDYADSEGYDNLKEAYESLGMSDTYEDYVKSSLINGMLKEKKLKMFHDRRNDKFFWYLI